MKPTLSLLALLCLCFSNNSLVAQDQLGFQCHTIQESIALEGQQHTRMSSNVPCDEDAIDFESIPEMVIKVRFHYLRDINGNHNFQEDVGDDVANTVISMANNDLSTNPPLTWHYGNSPPPNLPKKMRYELSPTSGEPDDADGDGIFYHNTVDEWIYCPEIDDDNSPCGNNYTITPNISYQEQPDVIDIYVIPYHPNYINYYINQGINEYPRFVTRGIADGIGNGHVTTITGLFATYSILGEEWQAQNSAAKNLNHEIGHLLGLWHAFSGDHCDDTPLGNPGWCGAVVSNNTMDYNCSQNALSPCQLYKIHQLAYTQNSEYHDQKECNNAFTPSFTMIYNSINHTVELAPSNFDFNVWTPIWEINVGEDFYLITETNPEINLSPESDTEVTACLKLYNAGQECYSKEFCQTETFDKLEDCGSQGDITFGNFETYYNGLSNLSSLELIPPSTDMSYQFSVNVSGSFGDAYIDDNCTDMPMLVFENSIIHDGGTIEVCMTCFGNGCYYTVCEDVEIPECNPSELPTNFFEIGEFNYEDLYYDTDHNGYLDGKAWASIIKNFDESDYIIEWSVDYSSLYQFRLQYAHFFSENPDSITFNLDALFRNFSTIPIEIKVCANVIGADNFCVYEEFCQTMIITPPENCDTNYNNGEFYVVNQDYLNGEITVGSLNLTWPKVYRYSLDRDNSTTNAIRWKDFSNAPDIISVNPTFTYDPELVFSCEDEYVYVCHEIYHIGGHCVEDVGCIKIDLKPPLCTNTSGYFDNGTPNYFWSFYGQIETEAPSTWQHYWTIGSGYSQWEISDPFSANPIFSFDPLVKFLGDTVEICHLAIDTINNCMTDKYCEVIIVPPAPTCSIDASFILGELNYQDVTVNALPTGFNFFTSHYWTITSASGTWAIDNPTNANQTFSFDKSVFFEGDTITICHHAFNFLQGCQGISCEEIIIPPLDSCITDEPLDFEPLISARKFPCTDPDYNDIFTNGSLGIKAIPNQNENYLFEWDIDIQPEGVYEINMSENNGEYRFSISSFGSVFTNLEICLTAYDTIQNCLAEVVCHEIYNCEEDTFACHSIEDVNLWTEFDSEIGQYVIKGNIDGFYGYSPLNDFDVTITQNGQTNIADIDPFNSVFTIKYEESGTAEICIVVKENSNFCSDTICLTIELPDPDPVIEVDLVCSMLFCPNVRFGANLVSHLSGVSVIYDFGDQTQLLVTEENGQVPSVTHQYNNWGWFNSCVYVMHPETWEILAQDCKWTYIPKWCIKKDESPHIELSEFIVYPNPSDGKNLIIRFNNVVQTEQLNVKIVSAIGLLQYETNISRFDDYIIELDNLNLDNGQHYIFLTDTQGNSFGQSITVIKGR